VDSDLIELAAAHGVATSYRDGERKVVEVDEDVVVRILGLLDVDAVEPEARMAALARAREKAALGALPGTIGQRVGAV
jgi:4-alpha-glucanotransferase